MRELEERNPSGGNLHPESDLPTISSNPAVNQEYAMSSNDPPSDFPTPPPVERSVEAEVIREPDVTTNEMPPVRVFSAEAIEDKVEVVDERSLLLKIWRRFCSAVEWLFGLGSMIAGMAVLASIPIAQFLSLGYLLEVSGRITRTGKLREGFIGIRPAARLGSIVLGTWLMLWPIRFVASYSRSAALIDPNGGVATGWRIGLFIVTGLMIGHILLAWACGGKIRYFFWPFLAPFFFAGWLLRLVISSKTLRPIVGPVVGTFSKRLLKDLTTVPPLTAWFPPAIFLSRLRRGGMYAKARDAVWDFAVNLRAHYFFWLGLRGFAGALAWLFVPVMMIVATTNLQLENQQAAQGLGGLAGFFGSALLAIVILYLPFMQAHFAAENRFVAMFEVGTVRRMFKRAPIAFWFALLITLGFSLPLYLLKAAYVPREIVWLPSIVFVVFLLPARMITGWSMSRAKRRETPRFFLIRWAFWFGEIPVVVIYAFFAYFTQYLSWYGSYSLFEQHAFLIPVPFLGL